MDEETYARTTEGKQMHPSGIPLDRIDWPFKMPWEREMLQKWKAKQSGKEFEYEVDNPF